MILKAFCLQKNITQFIFICCVHFLIFGFIIFLLSPSFLNAPKTTCRRSLNSRKSTQHLVLSRYTIVKWNTGYWEPSCDDLLTVPVLRLQMCFCLYKLLLLFPGILLMCFIKSNYAIINYCRHFLYEFLCLKPSTLKGQLTIAVQSSLLKEADIIHFKELS